MLLDLRRQSKCKKIGVSRAVTANHPCNEEAMLVLCCAMLVCLSVLSCPVLSYRVLPGSPVTVVKSQPVCKIQTQFPTPGLPARRCAALVSSAASTLSALICLSTPTPFDSTAPWPSRSRSLPRLSLTSFYASLPGRAVVPWPSRSGVVSSSSSPLSFPLPLPLHYSCHRISHPAGHQYPRETPAI